MNALSQEKLLIGDVFADVHDKHGFSATEAIDPYPSPDPTVLFVGAQISVWKPRLDAIACGDEHPSYCPQDCIRLQNKDHFYDKTPVIFNSFFKTYGAIAPASTFAEMLTAAEEFLGALGIAEDRILIKTDSDLLKQFSSQREVLVDSESPEYYCWEYGAAELEGKGITIALKNEHEESSFDVGNIITITKNGEPLVAEWGFGVETLINAIRSDKLPIRYADMPDSFREQLTETARIKYVDALIASVRMAALDVPISDRGAGGALHEYIRGASYLATWLGKNIIDVESDIVSLAGHFNIPENTVLNIYDKMQYYVGRINYLKQYLNTNGDNSGSTMKLSGQVGLPHAIGHLLLTEKQV